MSFPVAPGPESLIKHGAPEKSNSLISPQASVDPTVSRAAYHVWAAVAFLLIWLQFGYVRDYMRGQDWQIYSLYFLAVGGVATRYLTGIRYGRERWHRVLFDGLTILFISLGVNLTGGIRSDLWLFYFIFVIAETLAASPRGFVITDAVAIAGYVVATWPSESWAMGEYLERLSTHIFFLILVGSIARAIAASERERREDLGALREALAASEERRRLARDLHDGVGHVLTRVILGMEILRKQAADPATVDEMLQKQTTDLRGAMGEMRQIVSTLRSETTELTLHDALRSLVAGVDKASGVQVELQLPDEPAPLSPPRQYHLARVVQEAVTNCLRHSGASRVRISVEIDRQAVTGARVTACVKDNGRGFDPSVVPPGHGIQGMIERLSPYGGQVQILSRPGEGTEVRAEMPAEATW